MEANIKNLLKRYQEKIGTKEILKEVVKLVHFDDKLNTDVLVLDLDGARGVIVKDEVDNKLKLKSLVNFVGREVNFVIKSIDEETGTIFCSRKEAQDILEEETMMRLLDGEAFNAKIINILKYGAYVEINGVTGLLKNTDFAEDYTAIDEILKLGDTIKVKWKKISSNNNIIFEAVNKYKSPTIINIDMLEPNQVILGVVRSIKPCGVFVQIAPNLDALCSMPSTGELDEDMKVQFKINKIIREEGKVRGKIIKVL